MYAWRLYSVKSKQKTFAGRKCKRDSNSIILNIILQSLSNSDRIPIVNVLFGMYSLAENKKNNSILIIKNILDEILIVYYYITYNLIK